MSRSQLTATSASWVQAILASATRVARTTGTHHLTQLIFVFLAETGLHHVGQAGLKSQTSGDPPALPSQSAGITGLSHRAQPEMSLFKSESKDTKMAKVGLFGRWAVGNFHFFYNLKKKDS